MYLRWLLLSQTSNILKINVARISSTKTWQSEMAISLRSVSITDIYSQFCTNNDESIEWWPYWITLWVYLISVSEIRLPWNLINADNSKRPSTVIDTAIGEVDVFARWILPPILAERSCEKARFLVDNTSSEERVHVEPKFKAFTETGESKVLSICCTPCFSTSWYCMLVETGLQIADTNSIKIYIMASRPSRKCISVSGLKLGNCITRLFLIWWNVYSCKLLYAKTVSTTYRNKII